MPANQWIVIYSKLVAQQVNWISYCDALPYSIFHGANGADERAAAVAELQRLRNILSGHSQQDRESKRAA